VGLLCRGRGSAGEEKKESVVGGKANEETEGHGLAVVVAGVWGPGGIVDVGVTIRGG
jgi:hypothetical protein